ncbi:MAG: hypothetical protein IKQ69_09190 [Oscillospiraceae bacterium]|nr:hypothetical protein [Oscillospiraceae bacterium]
MKMSKEKTRKQPSVFAAFSPLVVMFLVVGIGSGFLGLDSRMLFMACLLYTIIVGYACGFSWAEMEAAAVKKLSKFVIPSVMLMVLGAFLASTMLSGATPVLVVWLSKLVTPRLILPLSFLLCSFMCTLIGCNWTTCGTLGLVLFSIGIVQGVNPFLLAGAVVSGATFGTYVSPISDVMIQHAAFAEVPVTSFIKEMNRPSYISLGICAILYAVVGFLTTSAPTAEQTELLSTFSANVSAIYHVNPIVILPIVVCIVLAYKRVPIIPTMLISTAIGIAIGCFLQGFNLVTSFKACYKGFSSASMLTQIAPDVEISSLLATLTDRGGVLDFIGAVVTLLLLITNVAITELFGAFGHLRRWFFKSNNGSLWGLHLKMAAFCSIASVLVFNTNAVMAVAAEVFEEPCEKMGVSKIKIACTSKTWGTMVMNALPFMTTPLTFAAVFGFDSSMRYYPYAFIFFVISIVMTVMNSLKLNEIDHPELAVAKTV